MLFWFTIYYNYSVFFYIFIYTMGFSSKERVTTVNILQHESTTDSLKKKSKQFSKQSRYHLYPSYTPWKSWKEPKYPKDYSRLYFRQKVYFWVLNTGIRTDANKARYVTRAPIASQESISLWFFYFCWNTISYIKTYF